MNRSFGPDAAFQFLLTEVSTGLGFAKIARSALREDQDKIIRNTENARKAYDSILRFHDSVAMTEEMKAQFNTEFDKLLQALRSLGEAV